MVPYAFLRSLSGAISGSPFVRNAKYYLTIEKQERQPHELPLAEPDAHANGLENKTQDSKEIFHYAPSNGSFAKRMIHKCTQQDSNHVLRSYDPCG